MKHYFQSLQQVIIENWDRNALCNYHGNSFTFGEMFEQIKRLHIFFELSGVSKGDRIAVCGRNRAEWGICFLAVNLYEAVAVPVLSDFTPDNISAIVDHSESVLLFTDTEIWDKIDPTDIPSVRQVINISDFSLLYDSLKDKFAEKDSDKFFRKKYSAGFSTKDVILPTGNDKDLAVINYTSGSTGDPKGVMIRYECLSANVEYARDNVPCHPGDNILSILPMAHMFGLTFEMLYPLCCGATINYLGKTPSPTLLLKAMQEVRPYLVIAVPMIFEKIYRSKIKPQIEKPSIRFQLGIPVLRSVVFSKMRCAIDDAFGGKVREYIMGGAAVNPEVEEFLKRMGLHFTVGYGMTEAAPLMAYSSWRTFVLRSCGRAMDYVKLRIDSEDPEHIVGEIQAKGVNIFSGYFKNESATRAAFTDDGWFNTGDMGIIDKQGNLYIKGRCKSLILSSNGQNIYPEEIECEINSLSYVAESLVVSRESKLVALVRLDEDFVRNGDAGQENVVEEIMRTVNGKLPGYSQICRVEIVKEAFQKTPKQSIKRYLYK